MKRAAAVAVIIAAVVLGGVNGCHGTDPSPNPLKPCPLGQVRRVENIKPPWEYACFPATRSTTAHKRKKRR